MGKAKVKLVQQLEAADQKVQVIAEKTLEGTTQSRPLAELWRLHIEQSRRSEADKGQSNPQPEAAHAPQRVGEPRRGLTGYRQLLCGSAVAGIGSLGAES